MLKEQFYNDQYKNIFLQTLNEKLRDCCSIIFTLSKPYEETYKKDLYTFTFNELISMFGMTSGISKLTFYNYKSYIKKYIEYSIEQKLITSEAIDNIVRMNFDDIKFEMRTDNLFYISWEELRYTIYKVLSNSDVDIPIINRSLVFYGLLYFNIPKDKILGLTAANLSKTTSSIIVDNKFYNVDYSLIELSEKALSEMSYISLHGHRRQFVDSPFIIKRDNGKSIKEYNASTFNRNFNLMWDNCINNLPYTSPLKSKKILPTYIVMSGHFERLHNYEIEKNIIVNDNITLQNYMEIKGIMTIKNTVSFLEQYSLWKTYLNSIR